MSQKVVDPSVAKVRGADGIAVATGGQRACQQVVEVASDGGDLLLAEDPDPFQIAVAIESRHLVRGQRLWILYIGWMKAQFALQPLELFLAGDELWRRCIAHGPSLAAPVGQTLSAAN